MVGEGDDLALARKRLERLVGGRAGGAALAGEKLDDALRRSRFLCMGDAGAERQQDRQTFRYIRSRHDHFQCNAGRRPAFPARHTPLPLQQEVTME
jgi:hypothetical protein